MNSYYMRAIDKQEIIAIGVDLALLTIDESGQVLTTSADIVWDEIGTLYEPTGEIDAEGNPVLAPIIDGEGRTYWHVNLYIPYVLLDWAEGKRAEAELAGDTALEATIAGHIASAPNYFPLDEEGQPRYPNNPHRVLWSN